ncbi:Phospho-N-acetylmuramoyl-pentapeptide-transferase [Streptomyces violaceorubidus]
MDHQLPGPGHLRGPTFSGLLVLGLMVGMGLVGFLDDYIKIVKRRSLGLRAKAKMTGQLTVGITFAVLALQFADNRGDTPASTKLSFITDFGWTIGPVLFVIWALFMILAMSNGANLTDRPGRPGHRRLRPGLRRLHLHRRLAVPGVLRQRADPDQPGRL